MMETAHKNVLSEIEKSQLSSLYLQQSSFSSRTSTERQGRARAKTHHGPNPKTQPSDVSDGEHGLDLKPEALNPRLRSMSCSPGCSTGVDTEERQQEVEKVLNRGMLYKTSRTKVTTDLTRGQHEHRQHRRFQLTEHSLEYSHELLQRVSIKTA